MFTRPIPSTLRTQIRNRLSTFEQARATRACRDIQEILAIVICTECGDTTPNAATARASGWHDEQCASCLSTQLRAG